MPTTIDIYRSAAVLVREHGEDAALEAASRADAMLDKGDLGGLNREALESHQSKLEEKERNAKRYVAKERTCLHCGKLFKSKWAGHRRGAKVLVDQHGEGAAAEAQRRAESLAAKGAAEGAAVWRRILAAIEALTEPVAKAYREAN